jgi:hypothetical protein
MSVFKRGGVYWYHFQFLGQQIQESAHTANKEIKMRHARLKPRTACGWPKAKPACGNT